MSEKDCSPTQTEKPWAGVIVIVTDADGNFIERHACEVHLLNPVECRTCGGKRWVAVPSGNYPCPDCTPENVELQGDALDAEIVRLGGAENPEAPENVDSPTL